MTALIRATPAQALAAEVEAHGWTVADHWHLEPPRRILVGSFATITVSPGKPPQVEQWGCATWPACVWALMALWAREAGSDGYELIGPG